MKSPFYDHWNMEVDVCLKQKMKLYEEIFIFIDDENENSDFSEELINSFNEQNLLEDKQSLKELLRLLVKISNHHHRHVNMLKRIEKILTFFKEVIIDTFSNSELFNLFKNVKLLLLFLFENNIIKVDNIIADFILQKQSQNGIKYCHFFYPEIKSFISEENQKKIELELSETVEIDFQRARHEGENNSYICQLIRSDSIEDFITYYTKENFSLSGTLNPSLFETNSFLLKNNPSIIEYASFFGSIQIFNFLCMNRVKLTPSLWLYVIHSKNPELIHRLEEFKVELNEELFEKCIEESIKCHHNDFSQYFRLQYEKDNFHYKKSIVEHGFHYHNYAFFPEKYNDKELFYYSSQYDYYSLVQLLLKILNYGISNVIILNELYFILF